MMNLLAAAALVAAGLSGGAPAAPQAPTLAVPQGAELAHGGGCRKSSPPGQCCHAGSQPYHCH